MNQSNKTFGFYFLISSLVITGATFISSAALAADRDAELFTATSDAFSGSLDMKAEVDTDSNLVDFVYTAVGTTKTVQISDLKAGIVLYQASGKNAAVLSSANFDAKTGGSLSLKYLQDGVSDSYATFNCEIIRQGQNWIMMAPDSSGSEKLFTTMYLKAKKLLGKVIGIASITVQ